MMIRLHKITAALLLSAALTVPTGVTAVFADTTITETTEQTESKPVVVSYSLLNAKNTNKTLTSVKAGTEFAMKITVKDIGMKKTDIKSADDIDFIKSLDTFKCTLNSIEIKDSKDGLLVYDINLTGCKWSGGDKTFGFMLGFPSKSSDYKDMSINIAECVTSSYNTGGDDSVAEPMFRISTPELSKPITAGEEGTLTVSIKNLGSTSAERVLVDFASTDDLTFIDGSGSQEINYIVAGATETVKLRYKAADKITSSRQNISVSMRYYYDNGSSEVQGNATASMNVSSEVSSTQKTYPVIIPDFSLSEKQLSPNTEYTGTVTVKNIGTADMNGVFAKFTGTDSFIITGGTSSAYVSKIAQGKSATFTVKIKTLNEISSLRQDLSMTLKYNYMMSGEEQSDTYDGTFTMFAPLSGSEPLPYVTFSTVDNPIGAGRKYRYSIYIENKGDIDMEDVRVTVKGGDGINVTDGTGLTYVEKVAAGKKETVKVVFETAAELASASQPLDVNLTYSYVSSGRKNTGTLDSTLIVPAEISGAPVLRMRGQKLDEAITANKEYTYTLTITNDSDIAVRNLYIDFTSSDSIYFLDGTEYATVDSIAAGKSANVTVKFRTTESIMSVKQSIAAAIKYRYGVSASEKENSTECSVTLIAAGAGDGGSSEGAPNIILSGYDIGADQIAAGDMFTLALDFYNTSSDIAVENLIMTVNASGDISIYGGGNTYFYKDLSAAGALHEDVKLRALATAATGTSSVNISFKYDYVSGGTRNTVTTDQNLYIPIYQPDKMTFDVSVPTYSVYAGNEVYITTTYMNKGKSDIGNCKAEIVGDVSALSTSKVLGNLAPGANGSFDFIVTPYMGGQCEFTIKITYEDAMLNEVVKEFPVSFPVEEMTSPDIDDDGMVYPDEPIEEESGFPWFIVWIGVGVVVAAGVVVLIVVLTKRSKAKRRKLTEEDINWEDDLDEVLSESDDSDKKTKV